jgi:flagellar protein FlgJ
MNSNIVTRTEILGTRIPGSDIERIKSAGTARSGPEDMKRVAREMESIFINLLLREMRKTVPKGPLNSGFVGDVYTAMADREMSKALAQRGIGLAKMIHENMARNQYAPHAEIPLKIS